MGNMLQYIQQEPELRERFVEIAFKENSNIQDLSDFSDALFRGFDTEQGRRASKFFNDHEVLELFESSETKQRIKHNISDKEFKEVYGEVERKEWEVQRKVPKGTEIKPKEVLTIHKPKRINVKPHTRAGKTVRVYNRGTGMRWTKMEQRFVQTRKTKKISPKEIIADYNKHFKDKPRSSSSINTKMYRI